MTPIQDVNPLLDQLCDQIQQHPRFTNDIKMLGIRTGGEWIAQALHQRLGLSAPLGILDSSFYRDDFARNGLPAEVQPSHIPWDLDNQNVFLVDDVLFTGRTTRAAMNELFDYGRPASITLVTLVDRKGCRELPIQPDLCAMTLECNQAIKLHGPDPLTLSLIDPAETVL